MGKITKKRKVANAKVDPDKLYSLDEGMALVKEVTLQNSMHLLTYTSN